MDKYKELIAVFSDVLENQRLSYFIYLSGGICVPGWFIGQRGKAECVYGC